MARRKRRQTAKQMYRADGALCVTFVNSAHRQPLETYDDLIAWGVDTGALASAEAPRLSRAAGERPGLAAGVVRRGQTLRARLERILLALADGAKVATADFNAFNIELRAALASRHLVQTTTGFHWAWAVDPQPGDSAPDDLDRMLWPVLLSTADLLASEDRSRVRRCQHQDCGLFFIARGAASQRKWCRRACGERARSVKHYRRQVKPRKKALMRQVRPDAGVRMERAAFAEPGDEEI